MLPVTAMDPLDASGRQKSVSASTAGTASMLIVPGSVGLPSINHLDVDRVKRDANGFPPKQQPMATTPMSPSLHHYAAHAAPSHRHGIHQPPPASAAPASLAGLLSPPEPRSIAREEKEPLHPSALRHSLPSIHEALGPEQPPSYPSTVPPPSSLVPTPAPPHQGSTSVAASPADHRPSHFPPVLYSSQASSNPFSRPRSPYLGTSAPQGQVTAPPPPPPPPPPPAPPAPVPHPQNDPAPHPSFSDSRPSYSTPQQKPKLPTLHPLNTSQSPSLAATRLNTSSYASYPPPSSHYEIPAPQPANSMTQRYPYAQYPPHCPQSAPSASAPNPTYPPSASTYSAPPRYPPPVWREANSEMAHLEEKKINRSSLAPYGESVKRHLESFDLEASLNEASSKLLLREGWLMALDG